MAEKNASGLVAPAWRTASTRAAVSNAAFGRSSSRDMARAAPRLALWRTALDTAQLAL